MFCLADYFPFSFRTVSLFCLNLLFGTCGRPWPFQGGAVVKNLPASGGDTSSDPGSGRSPGGGMAAPSRTLAWRVPGTEEPGGLQSTGPQRWA